MELRLKLLPVTRRVNYVSNIVVAKDRQFGCRIADLIIALSNCLWPQEIMAICNLRLETDFS